MATIRIPAGYWMSREETAEWNAKRAPEGPKPIIEQGRRYLYHCNEIFGVINPEFENVHGRKPTDEEVALAAIGLDHFGGYVEVGDQFFTGCLYTD